MSEADMWAAVIGFFMPVVVALLNQCRWPAVLKGLCAFVTCAVAAFITIYINGAVNATNWVRTLLFVFMTAIATYRLWWNPSQIAPRIEEATTAAR